ncbi:protein phosphatase [Microthyrium microscopicum]|uniref:Protein phosphatase n=1 Tax=Microthyrium microscopicum TaxID=703497 RepID=A0A6A6UMK9_9PEZI|nr:protein phosphatase [Microthyrium microscopicum]
MHLRSYSTAALVAAAALAGGSIYYRGQTAVLRADAPRGTASFSGVASDTVVTEGAEKTRRALVVEQGQVYQSTIVGDGPLAKQAEDSGRSVLEMLTPEQATSKLRKSEESWIVQRGKGVVRYDLVQIPSNSPIEDDHIEKIIQVPDTVAATGDETSTNSDWMFWGVFDGHSGWTTSAKLRQLLVSFVARELNTTYTSALSNSSFPYPSSESVDLAIKKGFLRLDNEIVYEAVNKVDKAKTKNAAAELLAPALSGSCALLSFYDSQSKTLRVACTGDSRAILGRKGANGKWTAIPLSIDQTGANEDEATRLRKEHPGEQYVVANGRVLGGLEPTRAFGDAVYKWTQETADRLKRSYFARSPNKLFKTPPYVTAEPVVTTTQIQPEKGDFLIMATDGLWEMLTNEEAVGLVGKWLEVEASEKSGSKDSWLKSWFAQSKAELPVEKVQSDSSGNRDAVRQRQWGITDAHGRFVVEDKNVATHLVRNALGGKDQDQLCALLTLPSPISRRYRDDLTVQVIFFGDETPSGNVTLNAEATAPGEVPKPKL